MFQLLAIHCIYFNLNNHDPPGAGSYSCPFPYGKERNSILEFMLKLHFLELFPVPISVSVNIAAGNRCYTQYEQFDNSLIKALFTKMQAEHPIAKPKARVQCSELMVGDGGATPSSRREEARENLDREVPRISEPAWR